MKRLIKVMICLVLIQLSADAQPILNKEKHEELTEKESYQYPPPNPEERVVKPPPESPKTKVDPPKTNHWNWVESVMVVLCVLLIAVGLYFLLRHLGWITNHRNESRKTTFTQFEGEVEDIESVDVQTPLELALAEQNWRMAVRLNYLDLLKQLNARRVITWRKAKTNREYLNEITQHDQHLHFKRFLNGYELVWYGEKPINQDQYRLFEILHQKVLAKTH